MSQQIWMIISTAFASIIFLQIVLAQSRARQLKNAQKYLIRAKKEAQEIAQLPLNNPHPQIQISQSGKILFANPSALEIFPDIDLSGFDHPILQKIQTAQNREIAFENKIYQQTISPTKVNGETAYVIYCYDITERKQYERQLKASQIHADKMRISAENAKEARGQFLANMSHELRTPMNGIIGLSDILAEKGLQDENQNLIEAVNSSAKSLLILLNDILDFSKIEAKELTIEKTPFNIRKTIGQVEALQAPIATQKNLTLQTEIKGDVPEFFIGDPSRLQQILNNLINNALKFTQDGYVNVSLSGQALDQNNYALNIVVEDTGIGISDDKLDAVFEQFQQADKSTARKYGGTGLGLSITKNLTELMGGTIAIKSKEGKGTKLTLRLSFPIANEHDHNDKYEDSYNNVGIDTSAKLMIVDDHPINLLFLRQALTNIGFKNFDEASCGKQAYDLCKNQAYDLIIMDCQMPEMDGFKATRKIREIQTLQIPPIIIAATANAMKGAKDQCIAAGMDDYISKPIDKNELRSLLGRYIPSNENQSDVQLKNQELLHIHKSQNNIINWQRIDEFTNGDEEVEAQILNIFIDNFEADIDNLKRSYAQKNFEHWDSWAHKLYGASAHIGADELAEKCDEGQSLSVKSETEKQARIEQIHNSILEKYYAVKTVLEQRKHKSLL